MVVFDCCWFTYAFLLRRSPSCTQGMVLLFDVIKTTNRHVPPVLPRQSVRHPSLCASHCVCVRGVAALFDDDVRTCRHVIGKLFSRHY